MDSILKILFALVIPLCPCFAGTPTAEESKACYGAAGIKCTTHNLKCTDGRISIQEAFYEKNNKCPTVGTDCADFNISNISLSGETTNFSSTELKSLCRICSMNSTCRLPPVRSTGSGLSVIIYQCITGNGRPDRVCNSILKETTAAATTLKSSTVNENETPEVEEGTTHSGWSTDHTTKHKFPNQTTLRSTTANTNRTTATATATATATQEPTAALSSQTLSGSSSIFPSDKTTQTENGTETALTTSPISNNDTGDSKQQDADTGTIVGIVIPLCIFIAGVVTAVIILRRRKLGRKDKNGNVTKRKSDQQQVHSLEKTSSPDYDYATTNECLDLVPKAHNTPAPLKGSSDYNYAGSNANHEVKPQELSTTSDYDYATCKQTNHDNPSSRNTQTRDIDYDHIGHQPARANSHYDTTLSVDETLERGNDNEEVYSYNHLNEKSVSNIDADSTYNTTSSTRHEMDSSTNDMEDNYGYNHLGTETKKNLPQSEYDTTASAIRDLARINDSTYDHAYLLTSDSSPSGMINAGSQESDYDHASTTTSHKDECESNASRNRSHQEEGVADVYMIAGEANTNPYQLAK